ncbi:hypothetical protein OURE66S_01347 [Oligella ureolytica]
MHFPEAIDGRDVDHFDQFCQHLIVMDTKENLVVGTYRILTPEKSVEAGGFYSESEFELSQMEHLRSELSECGRSCTHPDYRDGAVIMLLCGAAWPNSCDIIIYNIYLVVPVLV